MAWGVHMLAVVPFVSRALNPTVLVTGVLAWLDTTNPRGLFLVSTD